MKYTEAGFRAFYHQFTALKLKKSLRGLLEGFPAAAEATYALTYGYIDPERGLTLEVLAAAKKGRKGFQFAVGNDEIRSFIRIDAVEEEDFWFFADEDGTLAKRHAAKLELLKRYDASEEIEKTRQMTFLDGCRDGYNIDDVLVELNRKGRQKEACWVKLTGLGDHYFVGTLLNEPLQDFGYHEGERIAFFAEQAEDGRIICRCDLNPSRELTEKDLEDGRLLREAIAAFRTDRSRDNFLEVLELLRDSVLWVPCTAVLSEEDEKTVWEMAKQNEKDPAAMIGQNIAFKDNVRLIPDILQNQDGYFFPAFSGEEEMGDYGDGFSKVPMHMLEVIRLARENKYNPSGIVIDASTEALVIDHEIWENIERMKSRIVEGDESDDDRS